MLLTVAEFLISIHLVTAVNINDSTSSTSDNSTNFPDSSTVSADYFAERQRQILCDLKCKCPEKGQSLMFLDCGQRGISSLPISLHIEPTVRRLSFQGNHLESLKMRTFSTADEVQELDFSLNIITKVENHTFAPFLSLTRLSLSHNRLTELSSGLLDGLFELRVLELGHNIIQRISYESFQTTPHLQELRIPYNPIFDLPENIFRYLPNLEKLDLQDTGLVMLPSNIFRPTPRLHWLSLATNAFENVPEDALSVAPHLEILNLSENDFTVLVEGAFRRLSNISVLYLNNLDRLTRIEKNALTGLTKLKSFSCSYNPKLSYIDEDVFGTGYSNISRIKTPPREQLYLRQNALRTMRSPLEPTTWSALSFVDLAQNPWKCDCNLLWMLELTPETQVSIICDSPRKLRGRTFNTIDPSELRCEGANWALATFALVIACLLAFGAVMVAAMAVVCSRTPIGLFVRARQQFSYAKVTPKTETVDLEWDPSAEI